MAVWDELRLTLARLLEEQPGALRGYPDLSRSEGGPPPFAIRLAPWAEDVAGELSKRFGDQVDLTVGALPTRRTVRRVGVSGGGAARVSPQNCSTRARPRPSLTAQPPSAPGTRCGTGCWSATAPTASCRSRPTATSPPGSSIRRPARRWEASPGGGFPLVMFRIAPGATERIPLLIGTASSTARLGYAVPPGSWGLQTTLDLAQDPGERVPRRTPVLPLTITA